MNLDFVEGCACAWPERVALWFGDVSHTYAELDARARRLARRLHERGLRGGERVGILAANHLAHFDLPAAAPKLGFIYAPFNHRLSTAELKGVVERVRPSLLFVDAEREAQAATLDLPWLPLSAYESWLAGGGDAKIVPEGGPLSPDALHMLLFTGGSTGTPKAACLPYRQTLGNAIDTVAAWNLTAEDCAIQCTPCFHAAANVLSLPLLLAGGQVVLVPRFEPREYLRLVETHRVSLMFMAPTMFQTLANDPAFAMTALGRVRWAISGGAPCPPNMRDAYTRRGIAFRQGYGMTEAGVNCFRIDAVDAARSPQSVGRPMPNIDALIRRADGSPAATGEVGELTLSGPQICAGYFGDGQDDTEGFRDGWLWTGDLALCDADGLYSLCGRRKEMYISGGENIYPAEVEAALAQCAGVVGSAVFGWPHPQWGECGVAVVVLNEGASADANRLRAELRTLLAGYKIPQDFLFVSELPKSAVGKISKPAARALYEAERQPATPLSVAA